MQGRAGTVRLTADAVVGPSGAKIRLYSAEVQSGATAGIVIFRDGTSGSDVARSQIDGTINEGVFRDYGHNGMLFENGCFYDEDANVTYTSITFEVEN